MKKLMRIINTPNTKEEETTLNLLDDLKKYNALLDSSKNDVRFYKNKIKEVINSLKKINKK